MNIERVEKKLRSTIVAAKLLDYRVYIKDDILWFDKEQEWIGLGLEKSCIKLHNSDVDKELSCYTLKDAEKKIIELL